MLEEEKKIEFDFQPRRIVLTGFRATGKSAVGIRLAQRLGFDFVDTDARLCDDLQCTIADFVHEYGWPAFRQREKELLVELAATTGTVIATGGGAILHNDEWRALREDSLVVWLRAGADTIRQRLLQDRATADQRPSLTGADRDDEVDEQLQVRTPLYDEGSDMSVDTTARAPDEIVTAILKEFSAGNEG